MTPPRRSTSEQNQGGFLSSTTFLGFRRPSGAPGARNHLAVISTMDNTNPIVRRICANLKDVVGVNTTFGRNLMGEDETQHFRVMGHLAGHPNVGAAIIISLEPNSAEKLAEVAAKASPWMPIEIATFHQTGGTLRISNYVQELSKKLSEHLDSNRRQECDLGEITIGVECGGSDTTSGLVSNPVTGLVSDRVVNLGGTVVFSETLEIVGAENLLAERAADIETRTLLLESVERAIHYALEMGIDLIGCNPTPDNIRGGLTSIEEKSLGAIKKAGSGPIVEVVGVGERPSRRGVVFSDAPCGGVENLTSLAASGAQVILFSTGVGNPIGNPIVPTIKITGNPQTALCMSEDIDLDISAVLKGQISYDEAADLLENKLCEVLSGKLTAAELLGETEITVSRRALNL